MSGSLRFGFLGPLEATDDGRECTPTAPLVRTLLALLLVRVGVVVPIAELVEELWSTDPPASAANTLQVFVGRTRRLLVPRCGPRDSRQVLVTAPGGYSLRVKSEQLDSYRFERLARDGARCLLDGDPARAGETLRAALALWRGPAFADLPTGVVLRAHAVALTEARLTALEHRIDADLALGRHHELVGELHALAARHPLRETFWRQLMLALHRCDRQAEALEAYHRLRRSLADELGLDPGPQARHLHDAILARDPALDATPHRTGAPVAVARPVLRLPRDIADFTGRADVLRLLLRALGADLAGTSDAAGERRAAPTVVLTGRGGVGKTTVAVHAAHRLASAFADGQLYARLRCPAGTPTAPGEVLAKFLRALGTASIPPTEEERSELLRERLAGRRVLVVLDDAVGEWQVRPLLPAGAGCAALVTSRSRLSGLEGASTVELPVFATSEAVDLLRRLAGGERVDAEADTAETVARLCGFLPLAVRIAGAKLAARPHWSVADMACRLTDERSRLRELRVGDLDVRAAVAASEQACDPEGRRAFRLLGLLSDADFPAWVVAALSDVDVDTAESIVERLVDARLVDSLGRDRAGQLRYRLDDLVRLYAAERLRDEEPADARDRALGRLLGGYLDLLRSAAGLPPAVGASACGTWRADARLVSPDPALRYAAERATIVAVVRAHAADPSAEVAHNVAAVAAELAVAAAHHARCPR